MPSLGADMEAGTLVRWLVKPGDTVKRGDIVAEVETEKATAEVEIFDDGVVESIVVPEGDKVPVGTLLATIRSTAPAPRPAKAVPPPVEVPAAPLPSPVPLPAARPQGRVTPAAQRLAESLGVGLAGLAGTGVGGAITRADVERAAAPRPIAVSGRVRSSPLARKRAAELGVDLAAVAGTGPAGAVTRADVEAIARPPARPAVVPPTAGAPAVTDRQLSRRHAIATAMERSKREIPHYYLGTQVDMSTALAWLEDHNLGRPVAGRLLYAALLLKAVALATREVPEVNGYWAVGTFQRSEPVHLGVAISLRDGGLVAPAIHDADRLGLDALMDALRDLVKRARAGVLRSSEMSAPTITVTNLGEQGVETVFPIIFSPQVAIVGFGRIVERPWAVNGMLAVRPIVTATLAADHRVSDGHRGGLFLAAVDRLLQEPARL
jgi:pyruvate dehydrogenase E2 component (dihydrolipoamide acetyltransferase)